MLGNSEKSITLSPCNLTNSNLIYCNINSRVECVIFYNQF